MSPKQYESALHDASMYKESGRSEQARQILRILIKDQRADFRAFLLLAGCCIDRLPKLGMTQSVEASRKNIIRCLQKQNKLAESIVESTALIKNNPQDDDAYGARAKLKAKAKDWKGAVDDYSQALKLAPTATYFAGRANAYHQLGQLELEQKDLAEAEKL